MNEYEKNAIFLIRLQKLNYGEHFTSLGDDEKHNLIVEIDEDEMVDDDQLVQ